MLKKFRVAKQMEISSLIMLEQNGRIPPPITTPRPGFAKALLDSEEIAIIAEYKRASPSRGVINTGVTPAEAALAYAKANANALSILTEEQYFQGDLKYLFEMRGRSFAGGLEHNLPLLRKDFIIHPLQVQMSAATPASAILLIVRMLEDNELGHLMSLACSHGLECVVEVFDQEDLERAQKAGAAIIQVNNRDLDTLEVDIKRSLNLSPRKRHGEIWISASGIEKKADLEFLNNAGFDAALIGSSLMESENPGKELMKLRGYDV